MNRYTVEMDLVPHTLVEIIPGVTVQQQLGETIHAKIEIGPETRSGIPRLRELCQDGQRPDA